MNRKYIYSESKLSEVLGLFRAQLKSCRVKGEWKQGKGKGRPVQLSQVGVDAILKKYGIEDANLDGARIKGSSESQPARNEQDSTPYRTIEGFRCRCCGRDAFRDPENVEPWQAEGFCNRECQRLGPQKGLTALPDLKLVHVSQLVLNKRILRATNGTGEIYSVIVPDSGCWAIGDPLRIKPSKQVGYWDLVGKSPRRRGDRLYRYEFV